MKDFDYEVLTKKRLSRQSRGTIKSKRVVTLPHDGLTRKEWERMNGEVVTRLVDGAETPREIINWLTFKNLSDQQQREYLRILQEAFGVDMKRVANAFGVSAMTLSRRCTLLQYNIIPFKPTQFDSKLWEQFIGGDVVVPEGIESLIEEPKEEPASSDDPVAEIATNTDTALLTLFSALKGTGAKITIEVIL